ncbi:MAG: hypothetical protein ACI9H8_000944 [Lysobacterales bacterium]|jgi:hypothetical protein
MSMSSLQKLAWIMVTAVISAAPLQAMEQSSGTAVDDAYAAKVYAYMVDNKLVGEGRIRSYPFEGGRPHGSIQEVVTTEAEIDGHKGRLIIKHNYGAEDGLTPKAVYAADHSENYEALTIMFQREEGYDPDNNDWFWAEYYASGEVINFQGTNLSGRSPLCLSCHTPLGGKDREILNGTAK